MGKLVLPVSAGRVVRPGRTLRMFPDAHRDGTASSERDFPRTDGYAFR